MIDRNRIKEKAKNAPPADITAIGVGKPWRKSWRVLMEIVTEWTEEQLAEREPLFKTYYRDFGVWAMRLKRDPRGQEADGLARLFRDAEFANAFERLFRACETSELKHKIGQAIRRLRIEAAGYVSHD